MECAIPPVELGEAEDLPRTLDRGLRLGRVLDRNRLRAAVLHRLLQGRGRVDRQVLGPDTAHRSHGHGAHGAVRVVSGGARPTAMVAVLCIVGAAGCAAPAPPSRTAPPSPTLRPRASVQTSPAPIASASASPEPRDGLAAEIEVQRLDPALTHSVLEF